MNPSLCHASAQICGNQFYFLQAGQTLFFRKWAEKDLKTIGDLVGSEGGSLKSWLPGMTFQVNIILNIFRWYIFFLDHLKICLFFFLITKLFGVNSNCWQYISLTIFSKRHVIFKVWSKRLFFQHTVMSMKLWQERQQVRNAKPLIS